MKTLPFIVIGLLLQTCRNPEKSAEGSVKTKDELAPVIPNHLSTYISQKGWSLADTSDYSRVWWSWYEKDQTPFFVTTDINDDQIADYAVLLKKNNLVKLHLLISSGKTYTSWVDKDFNPSYPETGLAIEHGLSIVQPGQSDFIIDGVEKSLSLQTNGIALMEVENITRIYYWSEGELKIMNIKT